MKFTAWIGGLGLIALLSLANGEELRTAGQGKAFPADVDAKIAAWSPKPAEKRFDEIGWARDIRSALKLAKQTRRPVFLFTMDGRVNIGRC